jgi:glycosyltransferase involved in cell wall biosynthesis
VAASLVGKRVRVVYVTNVFPKISETFILNEILEMQNKGIDVHVFAFRNAGETIVQTKFARVRNVTYLPMPSAIVAGLSHLYWLMRNPGGYMRALKIFCIPSNERWPFTRCLPHVAEIAKLRPNHVHAHFGDAPADMALLINLLTNVTFSFTTHGYDIFNTRTLKYKSKSHYAKSIVVVSEWNRRFMVEKWGIDERKTHVVHCGVDFELVDRFRQGNHENAHSAAAATIEKSNRPLIVSVARLHHEKRLDVLVRACGRLRDQHVDFHCCIVGEGEERRSLTDLIRSMGLDDRVQLLGALTQEEVFRLLLRSAVKVLPSRSESMPVVLIEAMALGIPVIGPDIRGVSELIDHGVNGFLIQPEDVDGMADLIKNLLTDEDLRIRFAAKGMEKVRRGFNLRHETDKLVKIWTN